MTAATLDIGQLHASPRNPRSDVGDVAELVASIKAVGLLEPLVVRPNGDGYEVVCGARRLAAAVRAGLSEVACTVAELDDEQALEAAVTENLQRVDLSVLDEAAAYQALVDMGYSQRKLATRLGKSQPHISRRLSLLKLPEKARAAVDTGDITVEQGAALARVSATEVDKLFVGRRPAPYEIEDAVRRHERAEEMAAARKRLKAEGVAVLDSMPGPAWKHALRGPGNYGLGFTPEEHVGEPCHAAVVSDQYGRSVDAGGAAYVCTDPDRHDPGGASSLKTPEPEPDENEPTTTHGRAGEQMHLPSPEMAKMREEEETRQGQRREAIEARRAFVAREMADIDAAGAVEITALLYAHCFYIEDPYDRSVAEQLGIAPDTFAGTTPVERVAAYAAKGTRNRTRAVATAAAVLFETAVTPSGWSLRAERCELVQEEDEAAARAWFAFLAARGYELSDHDRELIPEPEPPAEPQPADAVAWYDDPEEGARWVDESEADAIEALDADRLHRVDVPAEEPLPDGVAAVLRGTGVMVSICPPAPRKKKWVWVCTCGSTGQNTTEEYANEAGALHLAGHGQPTSEEAAV